MWMCQCERTYAYIYIRSVRTCLWNLPDGTKTASVDEPMWMVMRHVCGPDGESGMRTRSTVLMWMNGQYDVVEVENKDVGHLGNSKVAASWIISFFEGRSADQSFKILNVVDLLLDF